MNRLNNKIAVWLYGTGLSILLAISACSVDAGVRLPTLQAAATVPAPTEAGALSAVAAGVELPTIPATNTPGHLEPTAPPSHVPTLTPKPTYTPAGCTQPGQVEASIFDGPIAGKDFAFQIYLPPCYGEDGLVYPVIYMLGGNIHDETIWTQLGLHTRADEGILSGNYPPFVIVMPDGGYPANFTSGGPSSYEGLILNELIPFVEANYCVWGEPAGRALGGLSRGGYWSLEIAFRHAAQFASVAGHSPAFLDSAAGPNLNPEFTVFNYDVSQLRIYVDIGADDYLSYQISVWHDKLVIAEIEHQWALNPGGHDEAYWSGNSANYLEWYTKPWPFNRAHYPSCSN